MVLGYIRESWETYKENAMSFILAELIVLIITGLIALIGVGIIFGFVGISTLMKITSPQSMLSRITSLVPLLLGLGVASIFFIIAGLVWVFLRTGIYGMAAQALRGKIKFEIMFNVAKSKGLTGILVTAIVSILSLFLLLISMGLGVMIPVFGFMVGIIVFCMIMILFSLVFPGIILDNLNTFESIKTSVGIVKRNYFEMLGLLLLYVAISIALFLIPIAGSLLVIFVISPMLFISLTIFYKKRK